MNHKNKIYKNLVLSVSNNQKGLSALKAKSFINPNEELMFSKTSNLFDTSTKKERSHVNKHTSGSVMCNVLRTSKSEYLNPGQIENGIILL